MLHRCYTGRYKRRVKSTGVGESDGKSQISEKEVTAPEGASNLLWGNFYRNYQREPFPPEDDND